MIILRDLLPLQTRDRPLFLAAGFFDGVHLGHRSVIGRAVQEARRQGGEAWVMSFDPHPMKILRPASAPLMLTATRHKLELLAHADVDGCILLPFSKALAATTAEAFAQWLFHCAPSLTEVVVGDNWRFGARAAGTPEILAAHGASMNIRVITVPPVLHAGNVVSSSRIRQAVSQGKLAEAAAMLGRPPSVLGTVIHGRKVGRTLGYPSANLDPHNEALPPLGVYAVQARIGERFFDGALSYGTRPTFDKDKDVPPLLELHLLDFEGSLYDQEIEACFIEKLRDEWHFDSVDALKIQIGRDIEATREILSRRGMPETLKRALARPVCLQETLHEPA